MRLFNKSIRYYLRVIHRDLGYLTVGLCIIFGISGIFLNHIKTSNREYSIKKGSLFIGNDLDENLITKNWDSSRLPRLKAVFRIDSANYRLMLESGMGTYNAKNGKVNYETSKRNHFVYWINTLHRNQIKGWSITGDIFALILIFLAISGMFISKGKNGLYGRGKWFLLTGIIIPIVYLMSAL